MAITDGEVTVVVWSLSTRIVFLVGGKALKRHYIGIDQGKVPHFSFAKVISGFTECIPLGQALLWSAFSRWLHLMKHLLMMDTMVLITSFPFSSDGDLL